jgi:membrane-associated protease RseP (regulator of RpoE activity)
MRASLVVLLSMLLLAGCGPRVRPEEPVALEPAPEPVEPGRYVEMSGQSPEVVARFRAAPPPVDPELVAGTTPEGDLLQLRAQGYVQVGTAYLDPGPQALELALRFGRRAGADRVLTYPAPAAADAAPAGSFESPGSIAICYVRYRLPFGARYRDLNDDERRALGVDWGVQVGTVIGASPAAEANLQPGDYVLRLDGRPIPSAAAFTEMLRAHAGRPVTLTIRRGAELLKRLVRLGAAPSSATTR